MTANSNITRSISFGMWSIVGAFGEDMVSNTLVGVRERWDHQYEVQAHAPVDGSKGMRRRVEERGWGFESSIERTE